MSSSTRGIMSDVEWRSPGGRVVVAIFLVILILVSIAFIFPFFIAFTAGLKTSSEVVKPGLHFLPVISHWENYLDAWRRFNMIGIFNNTFIVSAGGVFGRLLVSALAAYSLSRLNPFGKKVIEFFILITLTIPMIAYLIPLFITLTDLPIIHVNLVNTFWGLWIPYSGSAFTILVMKSSFDQLPKELYDAAAMDGASPLRMFLSFTVPISIPIFIVLGLLAFVSIWGDFLLPLLILRDANLQTVSVRLYTLSRQYPLNIAMAGSFIAMMPPLLVVLLFQRYMKGGLSY
jgi:multiple sugar transport system permease protein